MSTRPHPESARIIREARQAAGLTQKELAEKLDVTIGTIGYYERGVGQPKTDNLFALCNNPAHQTRRPPERRYITKRPRQCFHQRGRKGRINKKSPTRICRDCEQNFNFICVSIEFFNFFRDICNSSYFFHIQFGLGGV